MVRKMPTMLQAELAAFHSLSMEHMISHEHYKNLSMFLSLESQDLHLLAAPALDQAYSGVGDVLGESSYSAILLCSMAMDVVI